MSDLLAELDDQMRTERMHAIWQRHGKAIIALLVGIVLMTAAYSGYKEWDLHTKTKNTEAMFAVLKHEDFPNNVTADSDLNLSPSMRALVVMNAAGAYLKKEEQELALALYEKLAVDHAVPQEFRDLATLNHVRLELSMGSVEPAKALARVEPLLDNEAGAYYSQALIEAATLYAAQEDYKVALSFIEKLNKQTGLPETLYLKAQTLGHVYALKQAEVEKK